jgi:DNA recombination protein RmuC
MEQEMNMWASPVLLFGPVTVTLAEALFVLALIAAFVFWRWRSDRREDTQSAVLSLLEAQRDALSRTQSELEGRLRTLSDASHAQHAALRNNLDERLEVVSRRMSASLSETTERTHLNLKTLHERLAVIQSAQASIQTLTTEVTSLQALLSNKQKRGAFGEIQMQDLVKTFMPPSAYGFQETLSSGVRVDCLIKLPNPPGPVAVDAKFPLESWRRYSEADDPAVREAAGKALAVDILKHVNDIAAKYLIAGETADTALLFLPAESVYATLHSDFPDVVDKAFRKRVMIVSPTTFMATLHTMRAVMKDAQLREQAGEVQKLVGWLKDDVRLIGDRMDKLQKHHHDAGRLMEGVQTAVNRATGRAERMERIELGEGAGAEPAIAEVRPAPPLLERAE